MKRNLAYAAAVAALLLVGAGCTARESTTTELEQQGRPAAPEGAMKPKAEGSVDATVDAVIKDAGDEQELQRGAENDATELDADKAELNAYGDASYEVK